MEFYLFPSFGFFHLLSQCFFLFIFRAKETIQYRSNDISSGISFAVYTPGVAIRRRIVGAREDIHIYMKNREGGRRLREVGDGLWEEMMGWFS